VHFLKQIYDREVALDDTVTVVRFSQIVENPPDFQDACAASAALRTISPSSPRAGLGRRGCAAPRTARADESPVRTPTRSVGVVEVAPDGGHRRDRVGRGARRGDVRRASRSDSALTSCQVALATSALAGRAACSACGRPDAGRRPRATSATRTALLAGRLPPPQGSASLVVADRPPRPTWSALGRGARRQPTRAGVPRPPRLRARAARGGGGRQRPRSPRARCTAARLPRQRLARPLDEPVAPAWPGGASRGGAGTQDADDPPAVAAAGQRLFSGARPAVDSPARRHAIRRLARPRRRSSPMAGGRVRDSSDGRSPQISCGWRVASACETRRAGMQRRNRPLTVGRAAGPLACRSPTGLPGRPRRDARPALRPCGGRAARWASVWPSHGLASAYLAARRRHRAAAGTRRESREACCAAPGRHRGEGLPWRAWRRALALLCTRVPTPLDDLDFRRIMHRPLALSLRVPKLSLVPI
jgi:hypothetical protein